MIVSQSGKQNGRRKKAAMAKDQGIVETGLRRRALWGASRTARDTARVAEPRRKRVGPIQFLTEVRAEARKVTWTSWKETWITSIMVGVMVLLTALFFFGIDWVLGLGVSQMLKLVSAG
jgi:preprotein translocase subunit SecE